MSKIKQGFTLIEVLISSALLLMAVLAIASAVLSGSQGQKSLQAASDARTLTNDIATILSNTTACQHTFGSGTLNPTTGPTVSVIKDELNASRYTTGNIYGNRTLTLTSVTIGSSTSTVADPKVGIKPYTTLVGSTGIALVSVKWTLNRPTGTWASQTQTQTRYLLLKVTLSGSNISGCSTVVGGAALAFASGSGTATQFPYWTSSNMLGASTVYQSAAGNIGIGAVPGAYQLDVDKDIFTDTCFRTSGSAAEGTCLSDRRLKTDIHPFTLGLAALEGIRPKYYRYNGLGGEATTTEDALGVIAQDVEKTAPELVGHKLVKLHPADKEETEIKTVNYSGLRYIVINAIKELQSRWQEDDAALHQELLDLQADTAQIDADSTEIESRIAALEQENARIKALLCAQAQRPNFCP